MASPQQNLITADYPFGYQDFDPTGRGGNATIIYVGSWASRPTNPTGLIVGDEAIITDIPVGGRSVWYWDGAYWRSYGALKIAGSAVQQAAHTGTTAGTTKASFVLPAKALGLNGVLDIEVQTSSVSDAYFKNIQVYLAGTYLSNSAPTTVVHHGQRCKIQNRGSLSAQLGTALNLDNIIGTGGTNTQLTGAIDTSVDQTVSITFTLENAASSMTLESWSAILYN